MRVIYYNTTTMRFGNVKEIDAESMTRYLVNYKDENGETHNRIYERFKDADRVMKELGFFVFPFESLPGEIKTKNELFRVIRGLTAAGYMFEIRNYYQGGKSDRAGYMVKVLSHKSE